MTNSWLEINLEALAWNYRLIKHKLKPGTQVLAVVKANAYGHGMLPVAQALHELGVSWFGVASVAEGRELRQSLPDARVLVFQFLLGPRNRRLGVTLHLAQANKARGPYLRVAVI